MAGIGPASCNIPPESGLKKFTLCSMKRLSSCHDIVHMLGCENLNILNSPVLHSIMVF
jgi:hypothetical protein